MAILGTDGLSVGRDMSMYTQFMVNTEHLSQLRLAFWMTKQGYDWFKFGMLSLQPGVRSFYG